MNLANRTPAAKLVSCLIAAGGLFMAGTSASAAMGSKAEYDQAKAEAKQAYETAKEQCKSLKDNAEDVCKAQAKLEHTKREASAEAKFKNTDKAAHSARIDIAKAQRDLAEEQCDDKAGNDKDVCKKEAKAAYVTAKADADLKLKDRKAWDDAHEDVVDARYAAEKEKCDALSGNAKDACVAKAKAHTGK